MITAWVFTDERKTFEKNYVMYLLSYIKKMSKMMEPLKNKSGISLVKFVVTIISVISIKKRNHFEVATFGGSLLLAFTNTCTI